MERTKDVELNHIASAHLINDTVNNLSWSNVSATVKDRQTKQPKAILSESSGYVEAGQLLALMGPSGSGKTTLLNVLAQRIASNVKIDGNVLVNGQKTPWSVFRHISSYVEQEEALIGALTVRETLGFAAKLSLPSSVSKKDRIERVNDLMSSFGLSSQAEVIIGTPIRKGISGGQKRRVSVASSLLTDPKILFLDEPTSGLDSAASFEVMNFVRNVARKHRLIVVASIHQPSTSTYDLFDQLMLLSGGKTCYFGPAAGAKPYFDSIGHIMPIQINPAEFLLDLVNVDFSLDQTTANADLHKIHRAWLQSNEAVALRRQLDAGVHHDGGDGEKMLRHTELSRSSKMLVPLTLLHRSWIKSYRDVIAYGVRIAMYTCLAIMMGTVWLRLSHKQEDIQPYINAIFFGSAFMSFMAVAYVPSFIEDLHTYHHEHANGLVSPLAFTLANFLIGLPYLFSISVIFSLLAYFLSNFSPTGPQFFRWILFLFLDLLAAESLVVLVSSLIPIFVVALALVAFINGLWMSVGGFLIPITLLNPFWKYVFHYIDYQAYVFQGMMVNEFQGRTYNCAKVGGGDFQCMYSSPLQAQGKIAGEAVLESYGYHTGLMGTWVGILVGIIAGYRILGWAVLYMKR